MPVDFIEGWVIENLRDFLAVVAEKKDLVTRINRILEQLWERGTGGNPDAD